MKLYLAILALSLGATQANPFLRSKQKELLQTKDKKIALGTPPCEGECTGGGGVPNFGCATNIPGKSKYACETGGGRGCQYLAAGEHLRANFCVFQNDSSDPAPADPTPTPPGPSPSGACASWCESDRPGQGSRHCGSGDMAHLCGGCNYCHSAPQPDNPPPPTPTPPAPSTGQKCGGAVNFDSDPTKTCHDYLWGPTGDNTMFCYAYGGPADPCALNNQNDHENGIHKDPSLCMTDTFYLWDEPDTQGPGYSWAGTTWLAYSKRFAQQLTQMRARGTKVTSPLMRSGGDGVLEGNTRAFFGACGAACSDPDDPAYINVLAVNAFCGPWNYPPEGSGGCRGGVNYINGQMASISSAYNDRPVYITNWAKQQTSNPSDQEEAIDAIDSFFNGGAVSRVYWFGAKDYQDGATDYTENTYLTSVLPDGRTLGDVWKTKCDSI